MKQWFQTQIRHLITGFTPFLVDAGVISQSEADDGTRLLVAAVTIMITRTILILLQKVDVKVLVDVISKKFSLVLLGLVTAAGMGLCLPSCVNPVTGVREIPKIKLPEGVKGSFTYRNEKTGGELGLDCDDSGCTPRARQTFIDEDGNVVGEIEIGADGK